MRNMEQQFQTQKVMCKLNTIKRKFQRWKEVEGGRICRPAGWKGWRGWEHCWEHHLGVSLTPSPRKAGFGESKRRKVLSWQVGTEDHAQSRQLYDREVWTARNHGVVRERTHSRCPVCTDSGSSTVPRDRGHSLWKGHSNAGKLDPSSEQIGAPSSFSSCAPVGKKGLKLYISFPPPCVHLTKHQQASLLPRDYIPRTVCKRLEDHSDAVPA